MFIKLLKKEVKQFFRTKSEIFMLFVFPIVLITTLSVGLKDMMGSGNGTAVMEGGESTVYYSIEESSKYSAGFYDFMEGSKEFIDVKYEEASLDETKEKVDKYEGLMHISLKDSGFEIYTSKSGEKMNSTIFRGVFEVMINQYATYGTIGEFNPEAFLDFKEATNEEYVVKDTGNKVKSIGANEYYTFAELALIILFVAITVGEAVYRENDLTTISRIRMSKVREVDLIASKVALGVLIATFQTLLVYVYSTVILKVNWGENTVKFIILYISFGLFASVLGVMFGLLAKKQTTVSSGLNILIAFICAVGGCYTPLQMISSMPVINTLMYISPVYWINVATSSLVCGLKTNAYVIALTIPIVLSLIAISIYLVMVKRKGGILHA